MKKKANIYLPAQLQIKSESFSLSLSSKNIKLIRLVTFLLRYPNSAINKSLQGKTVENM